jgi:hypothetical protein
MNAATQLSPDQMADARAIGEALIATRTGTPAALEAFRAANRASRERWGDDMHEIIKARGLIGATGGKA